MGAVLHSDRIAAARASRRLTFALALAPLFLTACGSNYRPVISAISPVGPAGQPTKYAVVASTTGATTPGLATLVDFSGDTILNTTNLGNNPFWLLVDQNANEGYTLNGDGTLNSFSVSASLIQSQVNQSTLPAGSDATTLQTETGSLYATQAGLDNVAQLQSIPPAIKVQLPTGANTVWTVTAPLRAAGFMPWSRREAPVASRDLPPARTSRRSRRPRRRFPPACPRVRPRSSA